MNNKPLAVQPGTAPAVPSVPLALAIATVPMQKWETPYAAAQALYHGTIFPGLDLPFYKTGGEGRG